MTDTANDADTAALDYLTGLVGYIFNGDPTANDSFGLGCCLHAVVEDGNMEDHHVEWAMRYARENEHWACLRTAFALLVVPLPLRERLWDERYEQYSRW